MLKTPAQTIPSTSSVLATETNFELAALQYAEKHGIIEYTVEGSLLKYTECWATEGTFEHTVDLAALTF